ncbi:MAG: C39 family peptidase, partial [Fusobacteriaceae bacterium]
MAFKVNDYIKNLRKSSGYLVKDLTNDYLPGSDKIVNSVSESLKNVRQNSQGSFVKNVANIIKNSSYFNTVQKGILQSWDGLKSGNLYMDDAARLDAQMAASGLGLNFDLDDEIGGMSSDENAAFESMEDDKREKSFDDKLSKMSASRASGISEGDRIVARSTIEAAQAASMAQIETLRAIHSDNKAFMVNFSGEMKSGLSSIQSAVMSIAEFNNVVQKQFVDVSTKYYNDNNSILGEIFAVLKTEREEKLAIYKKDQNQNQNASTSNYVSSISKGKYGDAAKDLGGRFMSAVDNTYLDGMWGMLGGFLPMMLGQIMADPIGGGIKWLAKSGLNKKFKLGALDGGVDLNQVLASVTSGAANKFSRSENDLLKNLGYEMQIRSSETKSQPALGVNMQSSTWNSIANESVVTVIPTYLRKILSALTGDKEAVYDYTNGQFRSKDEIAEKFASDVPTLREHNNGLTSSLMFVDKKGGGHLQNMDPDKLHNVVADIMEEFVDKGKDLKELIAMNFDDVISMVPKLKTEHNWTEAHHTAMRLALRSMEDTDQDRFKSLNTAYGRHQNKIVNHWNTKIAGSKESGISSLYDRSNQFSNSSASIRMSGMIGKLQDPNTPQEEKNRLIAAINSGTLDQNGKDTHDVDIEKLLQDYSSPRREITETYGFQDQNVNKVQGLTDEDTGYLASALDGETVSSSFVNVILPLVDKLFKNTEIGKSEQYKELMGMKLYDREKIIETKGQWTKDYTKKAYELVRQIPEIEKMFGKLDEKEDLDAIEETTDENGVKKEKTLMEKHLENIIRHFGFETPDEAKARTEEMKAELESKKAERDKKIAEIENDTNLTEAEKKEKKQDIGFDKLKSTVAESSIGKSVKGFVDKAMDWKKEHLPNAEKYAMAATGGVIGVGVLGKILGSAAGLGTATASFGVTSPLFLASLGLAAGIWAGKKHLEGNLLGNMTDIQKDNLLKRTLPSVLGGAGVFAVMNRLGGSLLPFGGVLAPILAATAGIGFSVMSHEQDLFRNIFGKLPKDDKGKIDWAPMMKNGMWGVLATGIGAAGIKLAGGLPAVGGIFSGITGSMGLLSPIALATTAAGMALLANSSKASTMFFGAEGEGQSFHHMMKSWLFGDKAKNKDGLFTKYIDRFISWGKNGKATMATWLSDNIGAPIKAAMDPAKDLFKHAVFSIKDNFAKMAVNMQDKFGNTVTVPFAKMIETKIVEPFAKFIDKSTSWISGVIGKLVSAPIKFFTNVVTRTRDKIKEKNGGTMPFMKGKEDSDGSGSGVLETRNLFGSGSFGTSRSKKSIGKYETGENGVYFFDQKDKAWGGAKIAGKTTVAKEGCGIMAAAMALSIIHKNVVTPNDIIKFSHQYRSNGGGINHAFFIDVAKRAGLTADTYGKADLSIPNITHSVKKGNVAIACVLKDDPDTGKTYKHYIVIHGYQNGNWKILDPEDKSNTLGSPAAIFTNLETVTIIFKDGTGRIAKRSLINMGPDLVERDGSEVSDKAAGLGLKRIKKVARLLTPLFNPLRILLGDEDKLLDLENKRAQRTIDAANKENSETDNTSESSDTNKPGSSKSSQKKKSGIESSTQIGLLKTIVETKNLIFKGNTRIIHSLDKLTREISYSLNGVSYNMEYIKRILANNVGDLADGDKPDATILRSKRFRAAKGAVKNFTDRYILGPMASINLAINNIALGVQMYVTEAIERVKSVGRSIAKVASPLIDGVKWFVSAPMRLIGYMSDIAKAGFDLLSGLGKSLLEVATSATTAFIGAAVDLVSGGLKGIFGSVKMLFDKGFDMFTDMGSSISGLIEGIGAGVGNLFNGILTGIGSLVGGTIKGVVNGVSMVGGLLKGALSFGDIFRNATSPTVQKVQIIGGKIDTVTNVKTVGTVGSVDVTAYREVIQKLKGQSEEGAKSEETLKTANAITEETKQDKELPEQEKQTNALETIAESVKGGNTKDGKVVSGAKDSTMSLGDKTATWIQSFLPLVIPGVIASVGAYMSTKAFVDIVKSMLPGGEESFVDKNIDREGDADAIERGLLVKLPSLALSLGKSGVDNLTKAGKNFIKPFVKKTTTDTAREAATDPGLMTKALNRSGKILNGILTKLFNSSFAKKFFGPNVCAKAVNGINKFSKGFIAKAASAAKGKVAKGLSSVLSYVPYLDVLIGIWAAYDGWKNAHEYLDIHEEDCDLGMKTVSAITQFLVSYVGYKIPYIGFLLAVTPPSWYTSFVYECFVGEEGEGELAELKNKFKGNVEAAEREAMDKGEEFTLKQFRKDEKLKNEKIKKEDTPKIDTPAVEKPGTDIFVEDLDTKMYPETISDTDIQYYDGGGDFVSQKSSEFSDIDMSLQGEGATFDKTGCGPSTLAMAMMDLGINPNIPSLAEAAKGYRSDPTKGVSMNYLNDGLNNIGATTNVSAYNNTS